MEMLYTRHNPFGNSHDVEDSDICFLLVPFDSTNTGVSTSKWAPFIIKELLYLKEGYVPELDVNPFEKLKICDAGVLEVAPGSFEITKDRITSTINEILEKNEKIIPFIIGGEHLISLPVVESISTKKEFTIVQFDAHRDLRKDMFGVKYSHATWAYYAAKLKNVKGLLQIGIRSYSKEEKTEKLTNNIEEVEGPIYLTIDMDVFDPSIAPEVNNPESGGIKFNDFKELTKKVAKNGIVGIDIVECTAKSFESITASLAADVIIWLLGLLAKNKF